MPKPEKIFSVGSCKAAVFRNIIVRNGEELQLPKVKFELRYKDKRSGRWKGTSCLTVNELPKAILVLQKAYEYLLSGKSTQKKKSPKETLFWSDALRAIDQKGVGPRAKNINTPDTLYRYEQEHIREEEEEAPGRSDYLPGE